MENIVEKGEIAQKEQFHLFPQCFPKVFFFNMWRKGFNLAYMVRFACERMEKIGEKWMIVTKKLSIIFGI